MARPWSHLDYSRAAADRNGFRARRIRSGFRFGRRPFGVHHRLHGGRVARAGDRALVHEVIDLAHDLRRQGYRRGAGVFAHVLGPRGARNGDQGRVLLHQPREAELGERTADLRYVKQAHEISVEIKEGDTAADLYARFEARHKELYGTALGHPASVVTLRTTVIGVVQPIALARHPPEPGQPLRTVRTSDVHPHKVPVPVIDRSSLRAGAVLPTPCLVEEVDSMHYIPQGCRAQVDEWLNIRVATNP